MNRLSAFLFIVCIAFIALFVWFSNEYYIEETLDKRKLPSPEIIRNPMSALAELLSQRGVQVEQTRNRSVFKDLPPTDAAIVVRRLKQPLNPEREQALYSWMEKGGLLIYEPYTRSSFIPTDQFHDRLGVEMWEVENWLDFEEPHHVEAIVNNEIISLHMSPKYTLYSEEEGAEAIVLSAAGTQGVKLPIGQGTAFILTDARFLNTPRVWASDIVWNNSYTSHLNQHDHAYFILDILKGRQEVWLVTDSETDSFVSILYQRFPVFILFSIVWLVGLFWFLP